MFNLQIKHSAPLFVSAIMISIIEFMNVVAIYFAFNKYLLNGYQITSTVFEVYAFAIPVGIVLFILNTNYYNKRKERICDKYKGESLLKSILGYVCYICYFVGSIALAMYLG
jgi:uncharacterized membrane protein